MAAKCSGNWRVADEQVYSVASDFVTGAKEGLAAEQAAVKGAATGIVSGALGFVPWWVWPVALLILAFQLVWLRKLKLS